MDDEFVLEHLTAGVITLLELTARIERRQAGARDLARRKRRLRALGGSV